MLRKSTTVRELAWSLMSNQPEESTREKDELEVALTASNQALCDLASGTGSGKPRVLLVEDDSMTHCALRKILVKLGWEVHSATTVSSGLALLDLKPDAVILDLMLPDGDGADVLRRVRALNLRTKVAVTTGVEDRARLDEIRSLKPDGLLRKPLEINDLLRAIGSDSVF